MHILIFSSEARAENKLGVFFELGIVCDSAVAGGMLCSLGRVVMLG